MTLLIFDPTSPTFNASLLYHIHEISWLNKHTSIRESLIISNQIDAMWQKW